MKKLLAICLSVFLVIPMNAQEEEVKTEKKNTEVKIGQKGAVQVTDQGDTVKVKVGNKGVQIVEDEDGTKVDVIKEDDEDGKTIIKKRRNRFDAHWSGLELGMNNFLNADNQIGPAAGDEFMDLNTGKSWNVNLNFAQFDVGLIGNTVGLATGLGLEFNDYRFDGNNNIMKDPVTRDIVEMDYPLVTLEKSKLTTTYLTLPLVLEFQVPVGQKNKKLYLQGGAIGGLKLGSHTKVVYQDGGSKQKDKDRGDFNLSPLRYGLTARVGFGGIRIFANYYLSPFFENNKGPELYPFSIGIAFGD